MEFPKTFNGFAIMYGFKDDKKVYTNGSDLIPVFRVKQWLEHDNKLRKAEFEAAYECGKHENKWIPVSERLPMHGEEVLFCDIDDDVMFGYHLEGYLKTYFVQSGTLDHIKNVKAWMPKPEPYKAELKRPTKKRLEMIDVNEFSKIKEGKSDIVRTSKEYLVGEVIDICYNGFAYKDSVECKVTGCYKSTSAGYILELIKTN